MMSNPSLGSPAARVLPPRPNLEHLRNEAKQRLDVLRATAPGAKLADAQFQLAREYGFASWRELKADLDRRSGELPVDPVGDWIGELGPGGRVALHVRRTEDGDLHATVDVPDRGYFGDPADTLTAEGGRLSFTVLKPTTGLPTVSALYQGRWDGEAGQWVGAWTQAGVSFPLNFACGVLPPAPTVAGLDGLWDGRLDAKGGVRLVLGVRTDEHGTFAWCDSPDRNAYRLPATSIRREGRQVTVAMKTATLAGELAEDGERIEGRFIRGDTTLPLTLVKRPPGAAAPRGPEPAVVEVAPEALAACAGVYALAHAPGLTTAITAEDGRLYAQSPGWPKQELLPSGQTEFFCRASDATLTFELGADGRAIGFVMHCKGRDSRFSRVS